VWLGQRSWNGVAILGRGARPVLTRTSLPGDPSDGQARYIEATVAGVLIASISLPNDNPNPGPRFDYKLAWLERLIVHPAELMAAGVPVVLAGDYNVVPTEIDIYQPWKGDALVNPRARAAFARLLNQGCSERSIRTGCWGRGTISRAHRPGDAAGAWPLR
jgi:exodeoxyribonuclease-3